MKNFRGSEFQICFHCKNVDDRLVKILNLGWTFSRNFICNNKNWVICNIFWILFHSIHIVFHMYSFYQIWCISLNGSKNSNNWVDQIDKTKANNSRWSYPSKWRWISARLESFQWKREINDHSGSCMIQSVIFLTFPPFNHLIRLQSCSSFS